MVSGYPAFMKRENYRATKGALGEAIAKKYLLSKGYAFLVSNFQTRRGEVDLVMSDGETFVFVEVKLRTSDLYRPRDSVDRHKQQRLIWTAEEFLMKHGLLEEVHWRIDVVEIVLRGTKANVTHIKSAVFRGM